MLRPNRSNPGWSTPPVRTGEPFPPKRRNERRSGAIGLTSERTCHVAWAFLSARYRDGSAGPTASFHPTGPANRTDACALAGSASSRSTSQEPPLLVDRQVLDPLRQKLLPSQHNAAPACK